MNENGTLKKTKQEKRKFWKLNYLSDKSATAVLNIRTEDENDEIEIKKTEVTVATSVELDKCAKEKFVCIIALKLWLQAVVDMFENEEKSDR